jgi:hypothetical protein
VSFATAFGDCSGLFIRTLSGGASAPFVCRYFGQAFAQFEGEFSSRLIGQLPDRLIAPLTGELCGKRLTRFPGDASAPFIARLIGRFSRGLPTAFPARSSVPLLSKQPVEPLAQLFGRPLAGLPGRLDLPVLRNILRLQWKPHLPHWWLTLSSGLK